MAIDIRATVTCSLGTLISGSISDDYLQGSGLIKTKGSVEISGTITPAIGTVVTFSYVKGGVTRSIPRRLRVLSSFADPFRRTTKVELGCKLTYLSDVRESLEWTAFNDPENRDIPPEDAEIVTLPIYASSVLTQCLVKLGLAATGALPTNAFSIDKFDFSPGYVQVISDLLVSECYFGYLDTNEVLRIVNLNAGGGTGPVFTSADIVDIGPIGVGQLPGEAVAVTYSTLILKVPEEEPTPEGEEPVETPGGIPSSTTTPASPEEAAEQAIVEEKRNWERQETWSDSEKYYIPYKVDGETEQSVAEFTGTTRTISETKYETIRFNKPASDTSPADNESLTLIGDIANLPVYTSIGNTGSLTPEQAAEFETDPNSVLEEVWPDAELYDYVADGVDKWVYLSGGWTLNPPTYAEQYEADPIAVLNEIWPAPNIYDYVADVLDKWIHTGSGNWFNEKSPLDPEERYEEKEVPVLRTTQEYGPLVAIAASVASDRLTYGYGFNNETVLISNSVETFNYDKYGNQTGTEVLKYENRIKVAAASDLRWADAESEIDLGYANLAGTILTERIIVTNEIESGYTRETTSSYYKYVFSQNGQQALANAVQQVDTIAEMSDIIDWIMASGLVHNKTTTTVQKTGTITSQERPPAAIRANAAFSKGTLTEEEQETKPENLALSGENNEATPDPNNGYRVESSSQLELAVGSATAERRIELALPYAPDDRFTKSANSKYYATKSDAEQKAAAYGRIQNRLLLGNRNGMNLQLSPERIPSAPYDPLYVQANGLTAIYRANGTSWAFDSNGIVASIDALFWGAVGGTGTFWFPVAPGITTLPTTPAIVDGQMNATTVVLPYNETVVYYSRIRLITSIIKFNYSLELLTILPATVIHASTFAARIFKVEIPAAAVTVAAAAPLASISAAVAPPVTGIAVAAAAPVVSGGASVTAPATDISITLFAPVIEPVTTAVLVPNADIAVAVIAPAISTGTSVTIPAADIATAALAPTGVGDVTDPNFSSVSLLLHLDGTNGGTTFTDSSSNNVSITRGGNAALNTTFVKYGTASVVWDGSGDFLRTPSSTLFTFGTGDFTIEFWSYFDASFNTGSAAILMNIGGTHEIMYVFDTLRYRTTGGTNLITGGALNKSQWYHIAFTKSGSNQRLFIDGTQTGSTYVNATDYTADRVTFGAGNTGSSNYLGNMDDIRVTKGVARYTANFTAPTKAFPDQ